MHAAEIIGTTLEENLAMIYDTIKILQTAEESIFDAALFDGYKANQNMLLKLSVLLKAGAVE